MDTLQQVKLDKIENLLQLLVNLLNKKGNIKSTRNLDTKRGS